MRRVECAKDGRAFEFPETLVGKARLIGPRGGRYEFDAELLREFLREWRNHCATPSANRTRNG